MNLFEIIKDHPATAIGIVISISSLVIALISLRERKISARDKITPFIFPIFKYVSIYFKKDQNDNFILHFSDEELKESRSYKRVMGICLNAHGFNYSGEWFFDKEEYIKTYKKLYDNLTEVNGVDSVIINGLEVKGKIIEQALIHNGKEQYKTFKQIPYFQINETKPLISIPDIILQAIALVHLKWEGGTVSSFTFPPVYYKQEFFDLRGKKLTSIFQLEFTDFYSLPFNEMEEGMEDFDLITTIYETTKQIKKLPKKFR